MSPLLKLLKERAVEIRPVTLASGRQSNFYIDVKRVSLMAEGAYWIGKELLSLIQNNHPQVKAAGGLTLGADPLGTAVALTSWTSPSPIQSFIVRKELKSHGLGNWVEGRDLLADGDPIVVLEDVVTSGSSSLESIEKLEASGLRVEGVCCVVDREEGGRERIESRGYRLSSLYLKRDFGIVE